MRLREKLRLLLHGSVNDSLENLTDANCARIYRQEIREAQDLLSRRRDALGAMIASRKDLESELERVGRKIAQRESQLEVLDASTLTVELLESSAREIAALEAHEEHTRQRHTQTCEMIAREELLLRRLLTELSEHRRDLKILEAQLGRSGPAAAGAGRDTVSGRLLALQETRAAIAGGVARQRHLEDAVEEAGERIDGSDVDRCLRQVEKDPQSLRVAAVLDRLKATLGGRQEGTGEATA
ncbi:MAG: hypothetical protein CME59_07805 [Halioglobus sp.]|nr:hypothetical protein [Halioglobus sp.]|tara:strand:- start:175 stop:897 length:723 start_codon:yes stop_codon:yes gene_type:complete